MIAIGLGPWLIEYCNRCGKKKPLVWWAETELFEKLNGSASGAMCPACFDRAAYAQGSFLRWRPIPQDFGEAGGGEPMTNTREDKFARELEAAKEEVARLRAENHNLRVEVITLKAQLDDLRYFCWRARVSEIIELPSDQWEAKCEEAARLKDISKMRRQQLISEFHDRQLWQFISIDEWLSANKCD